MKFKELKLKKEILKSIENNGFDTPTEIQEKIIPLILEGNDVLGQSQTGTGKTLAFASPILTQIKENKHIQSIILSPTRELAIQIATEINEISKYQNINVTCVYGNSSIRDQIDSIKRGVEIVVGTPGRIKDLINRKVLNLKDISFFVLDEADEMLSMGFQEELEYIFNQTNDDKQVLLFSATMPKNILKLAKKYMNKDYKTISVMPNTITSDHVVQNYYEVNDKTRFEALCRVLDYKNPNKSIIFCRTKRNADDLLNRLSERGYRADVIHGDINQDQRIATLDRFKNDVFNYLIATDVAARGIHVDNIDIVINYNLPESNEAYVHRIGRTGRADKFGLAITFISQREHQFISQIEKHINKKLIKVELPKKEEILESKLKIKTEKLSLLKDEVEDESMFSEYVKLLNTKECKNILIKLLENNIENELGSDFTINVLETQKKKTKLKNRNLEDSIRVFMTIGKLDNITKRELLNFIEKTAKVTEGTCTGVEIMTKFTFLNIKKDKYDQIFKSCNNKKLNNRLIRIEKAKK